MELNELTAELVTPVIEAVVKEFGEGYVYPVNKEVTPEGGCFYLRQGNPSCIVGQVLTRLGVDVEGWDGLNDSRYGVIVSRMTGLRFTDIPPVHKALHQVQRVQDMGHPWGTALKVYKEELGVR